MPWSDDTGNPGLGGMAALASNEPEYPGGLKVLGAAFRQYNLMDNAYDLLTDKKVHDPQFNDDVYREMVINNPERSKHREVYGREHIGSAEDVYALDRKIAKDVRDNEIIAAGGATGIIASFAMGALDPTILVPGVAGWKVGKAALSAARSGLYGTAVGAGLGMLSDVVARQANPLAGDRPTAESIAMVSTAALIGGIFGSVGGAVAAKRGLRAQQAAEALRAQAREIDEALAANRAMGEMRAQRYAPAGPTQFLAHRIYTPEEVLEQLVKEMEVQAADVVKAGGTLDESLHTQAARDWLAIITYQRQLDAATAFHNKKNPDNPIGRQRINPAYLPEHLRERFVEHAESTPIKLVPDERATITDEAATVLGAVDDEAAAEAAEVLGTTGSAAVRPTIPMEDLRLARGGETLTALNRRPGWRMASSPSSRLGLSPDREVRQVAAELVDSPFITKGNIREARVQRIVEKGPNGEEIIREIVEPPVTNPVPAAVESRMLIDVIHFKTLDISKKALAAYRNSTKGDAAPESASMSNSAFRKAISMAMRRDDLADDIADVPENARAFVSDAAKDIREMIDTMTERGQEAGIFPDDLEAALEGTAKSYLTRLYNRKKIEAERPRWIKEVVVPYFARSRDETRYEVARLLGEELPEGATGPAPRVSKRGKAIPSLTEARYKKMVDAQAKYAAAIAKRDTAKTTLGDLKRDSTELSQRREKLGNEYAAARRKMDDDIKAAKGALREAEDTFKEVQTKTIAAEEKWDNEVRWAQTEDSELTNIADQITNHIIGVHEGRIDYNPIALKGPFKERVFGINDELIEDWLENDIERVMLSWARSVVPDVILTERFGGVGMEAPLSRINDSYDAAILKAKTPNEVNALNKARKLDLGDIKDVRDAMRGTLGLPDDPSSGIFRASKTIKDITYTTRFGNIAISALTDPAHAIMQTGIFRLVGDGILPFVTNFKSALKVSKDLRFAGQILDSYLHSRSAAMFDLVEDTSYHSAFERGANWLAQRSSILNLISPHTDVWKSFSGHALQKRMLEEALTVDAGLKLSPVRMGELRRLSINTDTLREIAAEWKKHGKKHGLVWDPNVLQWDNQEIGYLFRQALSRHIDMAVPTPRIGDKPTWTSDPILSLAGQGRGFTLSATQRLLLAGLQKRDVAFFTGLATSVAIGMLIHYIRSTLNGRDLPTTPMEWIAEGIDKSGSTGFLFDTSNIIERMTGVGVGTVMGRKMPGGKFGGRDWSNMLGPWASWASDAYSGFGGLTRGILTDDEIKRTHVRNIMDATVPLANAWHMKLAIDQFLPREQQKGFTP